MDILIAILPHILTLAGVCITAWASIRKSSKDVTNKLETAQAVTDTKIDELTRDCRNARRSENGYAEVFGFCNSICR